MERYASTETLILPVAEARNLNRTPPKDDHNFAAQQNKNGAPFLYGSPIKRDALDIKEYYISIDIGV